MFLPKLTCVRGMARRVPTFTKSKTETSLRTVKPLKKIQLETSLSTRHGRSTKIDDVVNNIPKESISTGRSEIIINPRQLNEPVHHARNNMTTFEMLNLRTDVINGLETMTIGKPTVIQLLGIPMVMEGKNVFCAAQTGSGKTFVYAVPIINMLRDGSDHGYISRVSRPRALIVAPARELAIQILKVFKSFSFSVPFRSLGLIGQKQKKWTREYMKGLVDVVVATPDILLKYHERGHIIFSDLQYIVFDEADTLYDENFRKTTKIILDLCDFEESTIMSSKKPVQCILTAATLPPKGILNSYKTFIPNLELCQSNLHKVLPNIKHSFIKTEQKKKLELLINKLELRSPKSGQKCIVFCNTSKCCNWVSRELEEKNIRHSRINGDVNPQVRFKDFENFINGETTLLVCTDIASRGLDTTDVSLVINFDCPFNASDYIHRSGRTGRATEVYAGKGEVVTFITQNKEVMFAQKVQNAAEKNECLGDIISKSNRLETRHKKAMKNYMDTAKSIKQEAKKVEENEFAKNIIMLRKVKENQSTRNVEKNQSTRKVKEKYMSKKIKKKVF